MILTFCGLVFLRLRVSIFLRFGVSFLLFGG